MNYEKKLRELLSSDPEHDNFTVESEEVTRLVAQYENKELDYEGLVGNVMAYLNDRLDSSMGYDDTKKVLDHIGVS